MSQDVLQTHQQWREWSGHWAQLWGGGGGGGEMVRYSERDVHRAREQRETAQTRQRDHHQLLTSVALYHNLGVL